MRIPSATYRVQFNSNFRFADAGALVPYLHDLGITDLYASPRFKARKGSSHGYDVADPLRINSELGTEEEFDRLAAQLHQFGMGLLLDIVPNHMAASPENPWWMDVLENGRESRYARFFDIDWQPQNPKVSVLLNDRVILPILPAPYAEILLKQRMKLRFDERGFFLQYEDNRLPINPNTYPEILEPCLEILKSQNEAATHEVESLIFSAKKLLRSTPESENVIESREKATASLKAALSHSYQNNGPIRHALDETLRLFNGVAGDESSFTRLDSLLGAQAYRLTDWHLAADEINYRRFFDINDLVCLRTEDPVVFAARHASIMRLVQEGKVSGLRVDHIDGLFDPLEYLDRLKSIPVSATEESKAAPEIYTLVEKITCGSETLPAEWPVSGTTGYDFLNAVNAVFVDPKGYGALEKSYRKFAALDLSFEQTWYLRKLEVMEQLFRTDVSLLAFRLGRVAALNLCGHDLPVPELVRGLKEITACLPVYRTYYRDMTLRAQDRIFLEQALAAASKLSLSEPVSGATWNFLRGVFLAELSFSTETERNAWLDFIMRWQQFTGAVMAKGLEDTALFAHHCLISVNEVGNNPFHGDIQFGPRAFHDLNRRSLRNHPHTLNSTSTHDTKWSEDARARINVLSEMPDVWQRCLTRWSRWNKSKKTILGDHAVPTPNEEVILYQAMLGIWPVGCSKNVNRGELVRRVEEFFVKAAKEAKTHTSWIAPNEPHEAALRKFVRAILDDSADKRFLDDFEALHGKLAFYGALNSCSQLILKMTSPGVPDFYQGNEIWNFCLTDPDNRRPVDFQRRTRMLEALKSRGSDASPQLCQHLLNHWQDGCLKLYVTMRILQFRRAHQELFLNGDYLALKPQGANRESIIAFSRHSQGNWIVVVAPRLLSRIVSPGALPMGRESWGSTALVLPHSFPKAWFNIFTGKAIAPVWEKSRSVLPVAEMFADLPLAVLTHEPSHASNN
ncbi:MAG: malto-oligosyltrehalose synthase [Candidatus Acidiferrales bacterium]